MSRISANSQSTPRVDTPAISQNLSPTDFAASVEKDVSFGDAIARGVDQTQSMLYGFANALGEFTGIDALAEFGLEGIKRQVEDLKNNPPKIREWDDVESLGDFGTYFLERLGEQAPQLAADLLALASGAGIGAVVVGKAIKRKTGEAVFKNISQKLATEKAKKYGGRAAVASMVAQGVGETQTEFLDRGIDAAGTALIAGGVKGLIDKVGFDKVMELTRGRPTDKLFKSIFRAAGVEATTETIQGAVDLLAIKAEDPTFELATVENFKRLREGAIVGGMIGGTVAGGGYGIKKATTYTPGDQDAPTAEPEADTHAQLDALNNPESTKDTVVITPDTEITPEMAAKIPETATVLETPDGAIITTNEAKAEDLIANEADEGSRGLALYNKKTGKQQTDGTVVVARDNQGSVVSEVATDQQSLGEDLEQAQAMAPQDGSVEVSDAVTQVEDRAERVAEEQAFKEPDPVDVELRQEFRKQALRQRIKETHKKVRTFNNVDDALAYSATMEKDGIGPIIRASNTPEGRRFVVEDASVTSTDIIEEATTDDTPNTAMGSAFEEAFDRKLQDVQDTQNDDTFFIDGEHPADRNTQYLDQTIEAFNADALEYQSNEYENNAEAIARELRVIYPLHDIDYEQSSPWQGALNRWKLSARTKQFPSVQDAREHIYEIAKIHANSEFKPVESNGGYEIQEFTKPDQFAPTAALSSGTGKLAIRGETKFDTPNAGAASASANDTSSKPAPLSAAERLEYAFVDGANRVARINRSLDARERKNQRDRKSTQTKKRQQAAQIKRDKMVAKRSSLRVKNPYTGKVERIRVQSIVSAGHDLNRKEAVDPSNFVEYKYRGFLNGVAAMMDAGYVFYAENGSDKKIKPTEQGQLIIDDTGGKLTTLRSLQASMGAVGKAKNVLSKQERRLDNVLEVDNKDNEVEVIQPSKIKAGTKAKPATKKTRTKAAPKKPEETKTQEERLWEEHPFLKKINDPGLTALKDLWYSKRDAISDKDIGELPSTARALITDLENLDNTPADNVYHAIAGRVSEYLRVHKTMAIADGTIKVIEGRSSRTGGAGLQDLGATQYYESDTDENKTEAEEAEEAYQKTQRIFDEETGDRVGAKISNAQQLDTDAIDLSETEIISDGEYADIYRGLAFELEIATKPKERARIRKEMEKSPLAKHEKEFLQRTRATTKQLIDERNELKKQLPHINKKKKKNRLTLRIYRLNERMALIPESRGRIPFTKEAAEAINAIDKETTTLQKHREKDPLGTDIVLAKLASDKATLYSFFTADSAPPKLLREAQQEQQRAGRFNRVEYGIAPASPISKKDTDKIVSDQLDTFKWADDVSKRFNTNVKVVESQQELPNGAGDTDALVKGYTHETENETTVYIVANNHSSPSDIQATVKHEVLAHVGFSNLLSSADQRRLLDLIIASEDTTLHTLWKEVRLDYSGLQLTEHQLAEEVLARAAERAAVGPNKINGALYKLRKILISILRKIGFLKGQITQSEINGTLYSFANAIRSGGHSIVLDQIIPVSKVATTGQLNKIASSVMRFTNRRKPRAASLAGKAVMTRDGQLRLRSKRLADLINHETSTTHDTESYNSALSKARTKFNGRLSRILNKHTEVEIKEAYNQLALEEPTEKLSPLAKKLRRFISGDFHSYLASRMPALDARHIKDFFPRIYETDEIEARRSEVEAILRKAGKMTPAEAKQTVDEIIGLQTQSLFESSSFMAQTTKIQNTRALRNPAIIKELVDKGFLNADPIGSLMSYLHSSTKRAEAEALFSAYSEVRHYLSPSSSKYKKLSEKGAELQDSINARTLARLAIKSSHIELDIKARKKEVANKGIQDKVKKYKQLQQQYFERQEKIRIDNSEAPQGKIAKLFRADKTLRQIENEFNTLGGTDYTLNRMERFNAIRKTSDGYEVYMPTGKLREMVLTDPELRAYTSKMTPAEVERELRNVRELITGSIETKPIDRDSLLHNSLGELRAFESLRVLSFSGVASIPEAAAIYARLRSIVPAKEYAQILKNSAMDHKQLRELAEDWGFIERNLSAAMQQELAGYQARGRTPKGLAKLRPRNLLPHIFKWNGNNLVVNFTKVAAMTAGQRFLTRLAYSNDPLHKEYLRELRISAADIQIWNNAGEGTPGDYTPGTNEHRAAEAVRDALDLFINQSVLKPTASDRVSWADDPLGGLIFHLKQFSYKFNKDILGGIAREAARKSRFYAEGSIEEQRANLEMIAWLMASMGIFVAFGALSDELRQRIMSFGSKGTYKANGEDSLNMVGKWFDRSGLQSMPWVGALNDPSVSNTMFELGPTASHIYLLMGDEQTKNKIAKSIPVLSQSSSARKGVYELLEDE